MVKKFFVAQLCNVLKAGVDPANILAITFTRKAAAEMRERILHNLQSAAATGEIDEARWRDLRDRLGDIAVSTIDAFCLSLLREFPLEADLDPGFTMADDTEVLRLIDEGLDRALRVCRGIATTDPAVALLFAQLGEPKLRAGLAVLLDRRLVAHDALRRFLVHGPGDVNPDVVCRPRGRPARPTRCGRSREDSPLSSRMDRGFIRASPCWHATSRRLRSEGRDGSAAKRRSWPAGCA